MNPNPLVEHPTRRNIWIRVEPWCKTHSRMGEWRVSHYYEDLGDGVYSLEDSRDDIICDECSV